MHTKILLGLLSSGIHIGRWFVQMTDITEVLIKPKSRVAKHNKFCTSSTSPSCIKCQSGQEHDRFNNQHIGTLVKSSDNNARQNQVPIVLGSSDLSDHMITRSMETCQHACHANDHCCQHSDQVKDKWHYRHIK